MDTSPAIHAPTKTNRTGAYEIVTCDFVKGDRRMPLGPHWICSSSFMEEERVSSM